MSNTDIRVRANGKPVIAGDGSKLVKEGRKTPCVKKLHQQSEHFGKPEYIHGHMFGAIGVLIGNATKMFCVLLSATIQDGDAPVREWEGQSNTAVSHVIRILRDAITATAVMGSSILLLDAYFLTVPLLKRLKAHNDKGIHPLSVVSRAKSSAVAIFWHLRTVRQRSTAKAWRIREVDQAI